MRSRAFAVVAAAGLAWNAGAADEPVGVVASIPPLAGLAERIGGAAVRVTVLVPPGKNPHTYEPTPGQMVELSRAGLLIVIGVPFETALLPRIRATMPRLAIADASDGIARRRMAHDGEAGDDASAPHAESGLDPHTWLAPALLKTQAGTIAAALSACRPDQHAAFTNRLAALSAELDATDAAVRARLAPFRGCRFYTFHPAFGYFADAYGLTQVAIEREGKSPSPRQLGELIRQAGADGIQAIVVQPEFDRRYAQTVADAIGGRCIVLNTLGRDPIANIREIANGLAGALATGSGPR